jgi:hypothetical protein
MPRLTDYALHHGITVEGKADFVSRAGGRAVRSSKSA